MNPIIELSLKTTRKLYTRFFFKEQFIKCEKDPNIAANLIYNLLTNEKPCMIARFGSTELNAISNFLGIKNYQNDIIGFITGKAPQWWWNEKGLEEIYSCSGFFPATKENVSRFAEMMINEMSLIDVLGSWRPQERFFLGKMKNCKFIALQLLEPFWGNIPWTKALENKKVLVIHPFSETIKNQYKNRTFLFKKTNILPTFKELYTIKAVQTLGGEDKRFKDWFEALQWMQNEMDKIDYDICLIGCGAYGFPLAAHAKMKGKKAVHLGGSLQLLFGIKGNRWEDPMYGVKEWGIPYGSYTKLMNEYWVKPRSEDKPQNAMQVENGCYW